MGNDKTRNQYLSSWTEENIWYCSLAVSYTHLEKVLFLTPSYAYFKYAADFNERESVCSDLINQDGYYTIDYEDFAKKASDPQTKLFILCNPHNPTGRVWREEELMKIAKIIEENELWVISDRCV